jgi:RHS repeat-associated protein
VFPESHGTTNALSFDVEHLGLAQGEARDYYYNESWQVVEERKNGSADAHTEYVWDFRYIDAPVVRWQDSNGDGDTSDSGETLYYTSDANMNVTAVLDTSGNVVERYMYDPYGNVTVLDGTTGGQTDWAVDADGDSDVSNEILYCGYRYDTETGLYHVRHRMHHPTLGRWMTRDLEGYLDGQNLAEYSLSSPPAVVDPLGAKALPLPGGNKVILRGKDAVSKARDTVSKQRTEAWNRMQEATRRGDTAGATSNRNLFDTHDAQREELDSLSDLACESPGDVRGYPIQVGLVPGPLSPDENAFAEAFAVGAALLAGPLQMLGGAGGTPAGIAAETVGTAAANAVENTLHSGRPSPLGFGSQAGADIAKQWETLSAGYGEIFGVWIDLQCQECRCCESQYYASYRWVNTDRKFVPCDLRQIPSGQARAGRVGGSRGNLIRSFAAFNKDDMNVIRKECEQQAEEKAKEHCQ